jgi:condensin complex subunit 2
VGGVNTLEANEEALALKKLELEFEVDPLFRKTCSTFDESNAENDLTM